MKQSSYKGKSPLPDFVIDAACAGNAEAVERVLQHYDGYINKLCTRTLYKRKTRPQRKLRIPWGGLAFPAPGRFRLRLSF